MLRETDNSDGHTFELVGEAHIYGMVRVGANQMQERDELSQVTLKMRSVDMP